MVRLTGKADARATQYCIMFAKQQATKADKLGDVAERRYWERRVEAHMLVLELAKHLGALA